MRLPLSLWGLSSGRSGCLRFDRAGRVLAPGAYRNVTVHPNGRCDSAQETTRLLRSICTVRAGLSLGQKLDLLDHLAIQAHLGAPVSGIDTHAPPAHVVPLGAVEGV